MQVLSSSFLCKSGYPSGQVFLFVCCTALACVGTLDQNEGWFHARLFLANSSTVSITSMILLLYRS
ncbi:hypothetical protein HNR31_001416 [Anoxybacillus caldiproteolyticus]|uniref:Uncharacterized protein n=1 Tax=Thermaerobacillus caldiproteolyticus TaxID=247480 RepID=A0A7W0BYK2_9BACL|nr:hypothetical protein [Anoxybacillus caldiproteolyticus]